MLFLNHAFKWLFATLLAVIITGLVASIPVTLSMLFIDGSRYASAQRAVESSNLRQIGQASLIYASDNHGCLPDAADLPDYARLLAVGGGLNDATIWFPSDADLPESTGTVLVPINGQPREQWPVNPAFAQLRPLFTVVLGGLKDKDANTTPISWTRGLDLETGRWRRDSPYDGEGGYIAFLGGQVRFYRTLQNASGGELVSRDGRPTHRLRDALPLDARISLDPGATPGDPTRGDRLQEAFRDAAVPMRISIGWAWLLWMFAVFIKLTLSLARAWGVPVGRVRIESRLRWLILAPTALLILSIVFRA